MDSAIKACDDKWATHSTLLAEKFNRSRAASGDQFEEELFRFMGKDPARHYWCAAFVGDQAWSGKNAPLPNLALLILQQGIVLCDQSMSDINARAQKVSMCISAAVLSEKLGLSILAKHHKEMAEAIVAKESVLAGAKPVLSSEEQTIYDNIRTSSQKP